MSYMRDKDAYTRGSGAIASADYGNARRARERRAKLRQFERDDRMLSQFTMGSRGGIGAIDSVKLGVTGRPTLQQGGNVESPTTGSQVGSGRTGFQAPPTGSGGGTPFVPQTLYQPVKSTRPMVEAGTGERTWIDPGPGGLPPPGYSTEGAAIPVTCADGTTYMWTPGSPAPCVSPTQPPMVSTGMSSSMKKWLLIAALVGGGAYLYARSKRGGR